MVEVLLALFDLFGQILHQLVCFLGVELGDTDHADLKQSFYIFAAHLADELALPRFECLVYKRDQFLFVCRVLISLLFIDAVLDEYFLQRGIEVFLFQFTFFDLQLPFEQCFGVVG